MPLPPPLTDAARQARQAFFCDLCQKGYARVAEWEAHEASYDHQHTKRLKEMKAMQKDPAALARARKAERRAEEKGGGLITIKPMKLGAGPAKAGGVAAAAAGGGFKKGGFKSAFGGGEVKVQMEEAEAPEEARAEVLESESDEEGERYDPARPTDCWDECPGRLEV